MREMKATLLQQVESHLLKVSLVRLHWELEKRGCNSRIVACIQDSIWVEPASDDEPEVRNVMAEVMTTAGKLDVPLEVDID